MHLVVAVRGAQCSSVLHSHKILTKQHYKAGLGELVPLEILGKHQQGSLVGYGHDIPFEVCKGLTKC